MAVTRLMLTEFRSYPRLRLDVDGGPVVLTGPNGAGKTNLLEAVSFLSPGRGLRQARLGEATRQGGNAPWAVAARICNPAGEVEVGTGLTLSAGTGPADAVSERRVVRVDGRTAAGPAALAGLLTMTWLTPQMDRLFMEGASGRRRFLDRIVFGFEPEHARRVSAYEKAMRERNRLLKEGRRDPSWLGALEDELAGHGVALAAARRHWVGRLSSAVGQSFGPFPVPAVAIDGAVEAWLDDMPALAAEDRFREALEAGRGRDAEAGGTGVGPHRSDLKVRHRDKDVPAAQCSTGEQKALLIALVLATARLGAAERGAAPLLLLDEVSAHLDAERRAALYDEICALGAQAWLTGTDRMLFDGLDGRAQFFAVKDGTLSAA